MLFGHRPVRSIDLKAAILGYLRYQKQYQLVALEVDWNPGHGYVLADIVAVATSGRLIEVEVKTSMSDLRADLGKHAKHSCLRQTHAEKKPMAADCTSWGASMAPAIKWFVSKKIPARFYYAVPPTISENAHEWIKEMAPYAGLLTTRHHRTSEITVRRVAPRLHEYVLDHADQWELVRCQSATLVRLARRVCKLDQKMEVGANPQLAGDKVDA
jgi:hypothetical protein